MKQQKIIFSNNVSNAIDDTLCTMDYNRLFVLTDVNTRQFVLERLADNHRLAEAHNITIKSGDVNKNLDSATVPDSVRRICSMAFGAVSANEGSFVSKQFTLYGSASSVAKRYCEAQELDHQGYHAPIFQEL